MKRVCAWCKEELRAREGRVCAWCKEELRAREGNASERQVTHGICSMCALEMTKSSPRSAGEILSLISEPIFLIDGNGVVRGANKAASEMLNKELPDIEDQLGVMLSNAPMRSMMKDVGSPYIA